MYHVKLNTAIGKYVKGIDCNNVFAGISCNNGTLYYRKKVIAHNPERGVFAIESIANTNEERFINSALIAACPPDKLLVRNLEYLINNPYDWLSDLERARVLRFYLVNRSTIFDAYFRAIGIRNASEIARKTVAKAEKAAAKKAQEWIDVFRLLLDPRKNESRIKHCACTSRKRDLAHCVIFGPRYLGLAQAINYASGRKLPDMADRDDLSWAWRIRQFAIEWRDKHGGKTLSAAMDRGLRIWKDSYWKNQQS